MTHVKMMVVDDLWSVIGSTNLDNRSFEHNDEMNVAIRDPAIAARLTRDFDADVSRSRQMSYCRLAAPADLGEADRHAGVASRAPAVASSASL